MIKFIVLELFILLATLIIGYILYGVIFIVTDRIFALKKKSLNDYLEKNQCKVTFIASFLLFGFPFGIFSTIFVQKNNNGNTENELLMKDSIKSLRLAVDSLKSENYNLYLKAKDTEYKNVLDNETYKAAFGEEKSSEIPSDEYDSNVYICTGESSTKYHSDPDCRGLSRCSGEIEEISEEEAEDMGRTPCKICY